MSSATYTERIREARPRLSKSFKRLADYILDSYINAALMTTSELAHEVDVDAATVVRFAQALDYAGFPELQDEIKSRVLEDLHIRPQESHEPESLAAQADLTLGNLSEAIERSRRLLDPNAFEDLVSAISASRRVLLLANQSVQPLAFWFAFHLEALGHITSAVSLEEASLAQALAGASEGDLVLAIDINGESAIIPAGLSQAKSFKLTTAAIVGAASFESARQADIVLEIQYQRPDQSGDVVLVAFLDTLCGALRWKHAGLFEKHLAKVRKVRKHLARK